MSSPAWGRTEKPNKNRQDWDNIQEMFPFIWIYKGRVLLALSCLVTSKLAMVGIPITLKYIVDILDQGDENKVVLPIILLIAYGVLRFVNAGFNELRDVIFARVRYHAMRELSVTTLKHLHRLSLRFHLERNTGGISRDMERGAQSISSILNYMVFSIIPTIAEFALVAFILLGQYDIEFAFTIFFTVFLFIAFTFIVTEWRMHYRHEMNALDSNANGKAMDSLMNYETVKYFDNEQHEIERYKKTMTSWEDAAVNSQTTMSTLNFGQGAIIAVGVTFVMFFAANGVVEERLTLGDLVLINTMMLQLFLPLNFLGMVYRSLKYAMADMDMVLKLLKKPIEVTDEADAKRLEIASPTVEFESVSFSYTSDRQILKNISFKIPSGKKFAVVGPSGAGKSTLARLIFRFYDTSSGKIKISGQAVDSVTQHSLRKQIGIVPQDTVLFNDSIYYNIQYAKPTANKEDVIKAAQLADIHEFIMSLPEGYETVVGERGLKLSGGEKQRVSIARVLLKQPPILVFDEATSSLDSKSEKNILAALNDIAENTTTLVIAHRLSTIVDADEILVLERGEIAEQGNHEQLLAMKGSYASLWTIQQKKAKTSK